MSIFKRKKQMAEEKKVVAGSEHLKERKERLAQLKKGNELSTIVFNTNVEKEKEKILESYLNIYEKALEKVEALEAEKKKLLVGKKSFEKDDKGELIEKESFDEQAVRQTQKVSERLTKLNEAIDKAMLVGDFEYWEKLKNLIK